MDVEQALSGPACESSVEAEGCQRFMAQKYHKGLAKLNKALAFLDSYLASRTWLVGQRVTLADVIVGSALSLYWITASDSARGLTP